MSCNCHNKNHPETPHLDVLASDIYNQAQYCFTDETLGKYLEAKIKEISGQLGISNSLNTEKVGGENKYIKSISQALGVIYAEEADIVNNFDDENISSDKIPSTKAVVDKIHDLDTKMFGVDGEYIQSIYEKDGLIHPTAVEFERDLTRTDVHPTNAPTSSAVKSYVDSEIHNVKSDFAHFVDNLKCEVTAAAGEYIQSIIVENGIIQVTKNNFTPVLNNSEVPPTSAAVRTAFAEEERKRTAAISDVITHLTSIDHATQGQYVTEVTQLNGVVKVKRENLPKIGNGKLRFNINGEPVKIFAANQENDQEVSIALPKKVSDLVNDSGFVSQQALDQKVSKEPGKQLSSNDFTTAEKNKLARIDIAAEPNVLNGVRIKGGTVSYSNKVATLDISNNYYDKAAVDSLILNSKGEGFTVSQEMLDKIQAMDPRGQENIIEVIKVKDFNDLDRTPFTTTVDVANKVATIDLTGKVNTVPGKQLSTHDYTTAEKHKLETIETGAEKNVQSDWNMTDPLADAFIKNKPVIGKGNFIVNIDGLSYIFNANQTTDTEMNIHIPSRVSELINDQRYLSIIDIKNKVDKEDGKSLVDDALIAEMEAIAAEYAPSKFEGISVDHVIVRPDSDKVVNIDLTHKVDKEEGKVLISADLVEKLENIEENANNYKLPLATRDTIGGMKPGPNISYNEHDGTIGLMREDVYTALEYIPAKLDENGKVIASQLPSYVDDIIEGKFKDGNYGYLYDADDSLITPETGKIYVDIETNKTYRWAGETLRQYIVISETLAIGETESTAFRGDLGKEAYEHVSKTNNPHNVTAAQIGLGNVENVSTNDQTPTYENADMDSLVSGETLSEAFGKIAATVDAVIAHTGNNNIHVTDEEKTLIYGAQPALSDEQMAAVNSGITASDVEDYDAHIADLDIHVTTADKKEWSGKQDALDEDQMASVNSGATVELIDEVKTYLRNPDSHVSAEDRAKWNAAQENIIEAITLNGTNIDITDKTANIAILTDKSLDFENKLGVKISADENNHLSLKDDGLYVEDEICTISLNGVDQPVTDSNVDITISGSESIDITDNTVSVIVSQQPDNALSVIEDGLYAKAGVRQHLVHGQGENYNGQHFIIQDNDRFVEGETLITGKLYYKRADTDMFLIAEIIEAIVRKTADGFEEVIPLAGNWEASSSNVKVSFDFDTDSEISEYRYVFSFMGKN